MKKLLIFTILALFAFSFFAVAIAEEEGHDHSKHKGEKKTTPKIFDTEQPIGAEATCPVTGETFTITKETEHSKYKGKHVYFCCSMCKPTFDKEPEKYLKEK